MDQHSRWNPKDFFEHEDKEPHQVIYNLVYGSVVWVITAFILGVILAAFVIGSHLTVEHLLKSPSQGDTTGAGHSQP